MNTKDLQHIKMAWLAAEDSGDRAAQIALLRDYPDAQDELTDFIAAYHVIETAPSESEALLPLTERATQTAMQRVFGSPLATADLRSLRARQGLSLTQPARGCLEKVRGRPHRVLQPERAPGVQAGASLPGQRGGIRQTAAEQFARPYAQSPPDRPGRARE